MFFLSCVNTELMVFSTVFFLRVNRRAISSLDRPSFRLILNMVLFCGGRLAMVRKDGTDGNVYALFYFYRFDRRYSVTDVISDGSGESPDRESGRTGHSFYGRA